MSSLEALLPDDLEKHVQLNRSRLTSYGVSREEIKTYCECRKPRKCMKRETENVHHTQEETIRWTLPRLAKARANKAKASTMRAKAKGSKDSKDKDGKDKDKSKDSMDCWNCGKRRHLAKDCWSKNDSKGRGQRKKVATDAHNLDSKKSEDENNEPEIEVVGFHMCSLCKPLLSVGELQCCMVTKVTCSTEVRMLRSRLMHGSRRR